MTSIIDPLVKNSSLSQPQSKTYYWYFLVLLPCIVSNSVKLWWNFSSTSSYFKQRPTFKNWAMLSTRSDLHYRQPGTGRSPMGLPLNKSFSCTHILLNQSLRAFQVFKWPTLFNSKWNVHVCLYPPDTFSSLNALCWVQLQYCISFCIIVQYPCAYIGVRQVLNNVTYVLQWQDVMCTRYA